MSLHGPHPRTDVGQALCVRFQIGIPCVCLWTAVLCLPVASSSAVAADSESDFPSCVVAQDGTGDFNGDTEEPIVAAVEKMKVGGTILIRSGIYTIWRAIHLDGAANLVLRGEEGTVLKLPPLPLSSTTESALVGAAELTVEDGSVFRSRMQIRIKAPGRTDVHHGKPVVIPTFDVFVETVIGNRLILAQPLPFPAPAGSPIACAENLVSLKSGSDITLKGLILDGGWRTQDPDFAGHVAGCAILANGSYDYEKGVTGTPIRGLRVRECALRNARGRCIAWYAVHDSEVTGCIVEDTPDAGIDLDHFCENVLVRNNRVSGCRIGVELNDTVRCRIEKNEIGRCRVGISIWRWCEHPQLNTHNTVKGNTVTGAYHRGVHLDRGAERNRVEDNVVIGGEGVAILIDGDKNSVIGNRVEGYPESPIQCTGRDNTLSANVVKDSSYHE